MVNHLSYFNPNIKKKQKKNTLSVSLMEKITEKSQEHQSLWSCGGGITQQDSGRLLLKKSSHEYLSLKPSLFENRGKRVAQTRTCASFECVNWGKVANFPPERYFKGTSKGTPVGASLRRHAVLQLTIDPRVRFPLKLNSTKSAYNPHCWRPNTVRNIEVQ